MSPKMLWWHLCVQLMHFRNQCLDVIKCFTVKPSTLFPMATKLNPLCANRLDIFMQLWWVWCTFLYPSDQNKVWQKHQIIQLQVCCPWLELSVSFHIDFKRSLLKQFMVLHQPSCLTCFECLNQLSGLSGGPQKTFGEVASGFSNHKINFL